MEISETVKEFNQILTDYDLTFKQFSNILDIFAKYGELLTMWLQLSAEDKISLGESNGEIIPQEIKDQLLNSEKLTSK